MRPFGDRLDAVQVYARQQKNSSPSGIAPMFSPPRTPTHPPTQDSHPRPHSFFVLSVPEAMQSCQVRVRKAEHPVMFRCLGLAWAGLGLGWPGPGLSSVKFRYVLLCSVVWAWPGLAWAWAGLARAWPPLSSAMFRYVPLFGPGLGWPGPGLAWPGPGFR